MNAKLIACLSFLLLSMGVLADDFSSQLFEINSNPRPLIDIARDYLYQGVVHILIGWDHLAFVLCLCLLANNVRGLLFTITAFTLGHSLSMALSFFEYVTIPVEPIEAIIAMSIVLMAREAWLVNEPETQHRPFASSAALVSFFGLIHGLGFASALQHVGVAEQEKLPALMFFNLGVELGQVMFVLALSVCFALIKRLNYQALAGKVLLFVAGTAGCFWTIERVSGF